MVHRSGSSHHLESADSNDAPHLFVSEQHSFSSKSLNNLPLPPPPPPPPLPPTSNNDVPNLLDGLHLKKITRSSSERLSLDTIINEKLRLTNNLKNSRCTINCSKSVNDLSVQSGTAMTVCQAFTKSQRKSKNDCVQNLGNSVSVPSSPTKSLRSEKLLKKCDVKIQPLEFQRLNDEAEEQHENVDGTIRCSLPLNRISGLIDSLVQMKAEHKTSTDASSLVTTASSTTADKTMCLYCDRTFSSQNLYIKHSERVHQASEGRRLSARKSGTSSLLYPGCSHCNNGKITSLLTEELPALFHHLIDIHFDRYFACKDCSIRFSNAEQLNQHLEEDHKDLTEKTVNPTVYKKRKKIVRRDSQQSNKDTNMSTNSEVTTDNLSSLENKPQNDNEEKQPEKILRSSRRQQAKLAALKTTTNLRKKQILRNEETILSRLGIAQNRSPRTRRGCIKPRPDTFRSETPNVKVRKNTRATNSTAATNQAMENVGETGSSSLPIAVSAGASNSRASNSTNKSESLCSTFDEYFYESVNNNVRQNLNCHIDGKLDSGPMSPSPISPADAVPTERSTLVKSPSLSDNEIHEATALTALTAFPTLLTAQQYGAEPMPLGKIKKPITKNSWKWKWDCVKKYKYVNEGGKFVKKIKQPIAGLRDLSKLDMWTQLTMRTKHEVVRRQEIEVLGNDQSFAVGEVAREEKRKLVEQLNSILDTRILPQINLEQNDQRIVKLEPNIDDDKHTKSGCNVNETVTSQFKEPAPVDDLPSILCLTRKDPSVDNKRTEIVLSGEWARPRCYICFGCGGRFETIKMLDDHKIARHPYVYSTHYEIVGKELIDGNLFRHFYVPSTALQRHSEYMQKCATSTASSSSQSTSDQKENILEDSMDSVGSYPISYTKSDSFDMDSNSRNSKVSAGSSTAHAVLTNSVDDTSVPTVTNKECSKCKRPCNGLIDLYRHMLDCSGDYAWFLAKKRQNIKYRYFGSRKRRVHRNNAGHRRAIRPKQEDSDTPQRLREPQPPKPRPSDGKFSINTFNLFVDLKSFDYINWLFKITFYYDSV